MESLNIAVIAPNAFPLTQRGGYGGTERIVSEVLTEWSTDIDSPKLDVFCAHGSEISSEQVGLHTFPSSAYPAEFLNGTLGATYLLEHPDEVDGWYWRSKANQLAYEDYVIDSIRLHPPDIVNTHLHSPRLLTKLSQLGIPTVANVHNDPFLARLPILHGVQYVALSDSHKKRMGASEIRTSTVPGGISLASGHDYTETVADSILEAAEEILGSVKEFVLYVGAISRRKGVKTAMELAMASKVPIVLAGPILSWSSCHLPDTAEYFQKYITPNADSKKVHYLPAVDTNTRNRLMAAAIATVTASAHEDSSWQESFGRVVPESLALGTPVLSSAAMMGAVDILDDPNVVRFYSSKEAIDIAALRQTDPDICRSAAHQFFDGRRYATELMNLLLMGAELQDIGRTA